MVGIQPGEFELLTDHSAISSSAMYLETQMLEREQIVSFHNFVRDLPYTIGGSRTADAVLLAGGGSCSGKHLFLGQLFSMAGLEVRYMMGMAVIDEMISWCISDELRSSLHASPVVDFHNFLYVKLDKWVRVDATFPRWLGNYGFVVNEGWKGVGDCELTLPVHRELNVDCLATAKEQALTSLKPEQVRRREAFLTGLANWMQAQEMSRS